MAKKRARAKVNIPMCAACILLCLTMFSFHFSSGVIARYSTDTSGGDSARVIRFNGITLNVYDVNSADADSEHFIAPGVPLTWNADVTFDGSESATYVFLEVTPTGSCTVSGDGMTYTLAHDAAAWTVDGTEDDDWKYLDKYKIDDTDIYTYVYYLSLAPNATLTNKKFFTADTVTISEFFDPEHLDDMTTVTTDFRANVVQSNGFNSPTEAWTSLSTNHP